MENESRLIYADDLENQFIFLRKMWSATEIVSVIDEAQTVDVVAVAHDRLFNLPNVSDRDYQDFVDGLEDYFKEAAFDDRSVGIFGMSEGETLLANALMNFLKLGAKMDNN